MTMTTDTQTTAPAGRVTLDEVRRVLADAGIDPAQTNAGRVRVLLGNRGSQETIQRALIALRQEQEQEQEQAEMAELSDSTPPIPAELTNMLTGSVLGALWQCAHGLTQAQMLRRIERTAGERDRAGAARATAEADLESLSRDIDESRAAADEAQAALAAAQAEIQSIRQQQQAQATAHAAALAEVQGQMQEQARVHVQEQERAAAAAALADAGRDLMRHELSRLTDQIGELKAALYARAAAAQPQPQQPQPQPEPKA